MTTRQPNWEFISNLGDRNPLDYDGYFVYRDRTGVYPAEAEYVSVDQDSSSDPESWTVYRVVLDQMELVEEDGETYLVIKHIADKWRNRESLSEYDRLPHYISQYDEWFHSHLQSVSNSIGSQSMEQLRLEFCSDDPVVRAQAYRELGDVVGWENLDSYPLKFKDREELEQRYTSGELNG